MITGVICGFQNSIKTSIFGYFIFADHISFDYPLVYRFTVGNSVGGAIVVSLLSTESLRIKYAE
jgi:formate/nitrite transporter FocA (FNT family)